MVNTLIQDQTGRIWIGTKSGLDLYDGYNIYQFSSIYEEQLKMSSQYVVGMIEKEDGQLWVATKKGINVINPYTKSNVTIVENLNIKAIRLNQKNEVVFTAGSKLYVATSIDSITTLVTLPANSVNLGRKILIDQEGNYYLKDGLWGVFKITDGNYEFFKINDQTNYKINNKTFSINPQSISFDNQIYVNLNPCEGFLINQLTKKIIPYRDSIPSLLCQSEYIINQYLDENKPLKKSFEEYGLNFNQRVTNVYINNKHKEILWIPTQLGFFKTSKPLQNFETLKNKPAPSIRGMVEDSEGNIYMGSYEGLLKYNPSSKKIVRLNDDIPKNHFKAPRTLLLDDDKKELWVGTDGQGVFLYNLELNQLKKLKSSTTVGLSSLKDKNGRVWIGRLWKILFSSNTSPKNLQEVPGFNLPAMDMCSYRGDTVLVGTTSGLYLLNIASLQISKHHLEKDSTC